jgi:DNA-binding GntR family transcriptional regulator
MAGSAHAQSLADGSGLERCLVAIREMVLSGKLLPGQKVHQAELAEQLNLSRIPVREALATLQAEGLLVHKPNTGFTVARFNSEDLSEIYLMRRLLETELLRTADLASVPIDEMVAINSKLASVPPAQSPDLYQKLNQDLHFAVFDCSPLEVVRQEVARLWYMSGFYRSLYLYEAENSAHLLTEHEQIIDAVRRRNVNDLINASDSHRSGTERLVVQRLGRSRSR